MLGVKTIGNATLIAYDGRPVLATDPWFGEEHDAYFGSWRLSHGIPPAEKNEILAAPYIWFSHGHPDHLNPRSVERLRHAAILLPDHVGGRIRDDLESSGYRVTVLPDGEWVGLSRRIRVLCLSDYIQDAVLLVDVGGRLFINMNDSGARARLRRIPRIARQFRHSYLLRLAGYGDADMINLFDEEGERIEFKSTRIVGRWLSQYAHRVGAAAVIPFSSFHQYQRRDSVWANRHTTPLSAYAAGFDERFAEFIAPFVWIDCASGETVPLDPPELPCVVREPQEFGDSWSDELERDDKRVLDDYFIRKEALHDMLGFLEFVVGNKRHVIDFAGPKQRGITFAVPRHSLMSAVTQRIFDDLLIGNFMKTELINTTLYPHFSPIVAKLGGNAKVLTPRDLWKFRAHYFRLSPRAYAAHHLNLAWFYRWKPMLRRVLKEVGLFDTAKQTMRRALGLPSLPVKADQKAA